MSYRSRVYRERNPHTHDEKKEQSFFSGQHDIERPKQNIPFFQAKLSVNQPGDSFENEADAVANAVVSKQAKLPMIQHKTINSIQRLATTPEEEMVGTNDQRMERDKEKPFQRMTADQEKEKPEAIQKLEDPTIEKEKEKDKKMNAVQRKADNTAATPSAKLSSQVKGSVGKGRTLPVQTLHEMNHSFGVDFSNVRIHNDSESTQMNNELNARAFTHGYDIYFNEGLFNPGSRDGKFLLAHELTHVIQQNDHEIRRDKNTALPKFDFPVSMGFFKNFDVLYAPDAIKPQEGTVTYIHNIGLVFDKKLDKAKQDKFRSDFKTNVQSLWQDKFLFELNDPGFTHYTAHVKLDIEFVDDPKNAHTLVEVKTQPKEFRSNVEGRSSADFPSLSHVAHLDIGDPSPEELAKKHKGKSILEPSLVQYVGDFDFDSAEINAECKEGIDKVEKEIDKLPDDDSVDEISMSNRIDYIGRASPEGNKWYNIDLSRRRAKAVKKQIESDKPKAKSIASNLTAEGAEKTQNEAAKENYRRVNVLVFPMTPFSKLKNKDQNIAAHEFGHMIGFGDEYDEKGNKKYEKKVEGDRPSHYEDVKSIMGQAAADELSMNQSSSMMSMGNDIKKGHYAYFLKAIKDLTGKQGWTIK